MRVILFCQNAYAFGIMAPIRDILLANSHDFIWYIPKKLLTDFPNKKDSFTTSIVDLQYFKSDVIFVPGNEVPYYLRGVKVQIFHGLAGEKRGHFRIRHYFDLYLTQGPYFTIKFNEFKVKYRDFEVIETGWPKLDVYGKNRNTFNSEKQRILEHYNSDTLVLYAPTFSPSLTSAPYLIQEIENLAIQTGFVIYIKFHDLMAKEWITAYQNLSKRFPNIIFQEQKNIIKFLLQADILILLKAENLKQHGSFLKAEGWAVSNGIDNLEDDSKAAVQTIDADTLAQEINNPKAVNLIVLGFALAMAEKAAADDKQLFCTAEDVKTVLKNRFGQNEKMLAASLKALEAGYTG